MKCIVYKLLVCVLHDAKPTTCCVVRFAGIFQIVVYTGLAECGFWNGIE